jgi:hypothetical protein
VGRCRSTTMSASFYEAFLKGAQLPRRENG